MTKLFTTLTFAGFIAAFGLAGAMDSAATAADRALYCEMADLWQQDEARGIAPEDRRGWPAYDGGC